MKGERQLGEHRDECDCRFLVDVEEHLLLEGKVLEEKRAVEGMADRVQRFCIEVAHQPLASDTNELGELGGFGSFFASGCGLARVLQQVRRVRTVVNQHREKTEILVNGPGW